MMLGRRALAAAVAAIAANCCDAKTVEFSNVLPRRDASGAIMNAHDGTTQWVAGSGGQPGKFYYHAMGYPACNETGTINGCPAGACSIYSKKNSLVVYSSPDLSSGSWTLEETVYPNPSAGFPECTYFRAQAAYNPSTSTWVLWANVAGCKVSTCPNSTCQSYAVGTSKAPGGPFKFAGMTEPTPSSLGPKKGYKGDYALFVDDADGKGYAILTHGIAGAGHRDMYIFRLAADFLSFDSATSTGPLSGPHLVEAPAFFKSGSTYYALLGGCTCMGLYGGGVAALTAAHPLGPWSLETATLDPGCPMLNQTSCFDMGPGQVCNPVTQSQQNYVITVPLAGGGAAHVWTGDKWQQSPNKMYDEQPQVWLPLAFDGSRLLPLRYVDNFTLDVAA